MHARSIFLSLPYFEVECEGDGVFCFTGGGCSIDLAVYFSRAFAILTEAYFDPFCQL